MAKKTAKRAELAPPAESPRGRPTLYDPKFCAMLLEHMEKGYSFEAFAGVAGVSKQTLYDWAKAHPEFLDAKEIGTGKAQVFWEGLGINHVISQSENAAGIGGSSRSLNASAWIFNIKNRFGWRDKQPGEADVNVNLNELRTKSDEELNRRMEELEKKLGRK